jgi:hypothetical protein
MTTPPNPADPFDRLIRKREILQDLGVNASTHWLWIKRGHFPRPVVLNPGVGNREMSRGRKASIGHGKRRCRKGWRARSRPTRMHGIAA